MCTFQRATQFESSDVVAVIHEQLLHAATAHRIEILAYCYMPDHLHLLPTGLTEGSDVLAFVKLFRQCAGYAFRRQHPQRLWQEGFYDRILRDEDSTLEVIAYIVANPVRGGLCAAPVEYPHCGSSRYTLEELAEAVQWSRPRG